VDVRLSAGQVGIRQRFAELFDADLIPTIRRLGEQPGPGAATDPDGGTDPDGTAAVRESVWRALVDLGALRLALPASLGGEGAGQQGAVMLAELLGETLHHSPLPDTLLALDLLVSQPEPDLDMVGELSGGAGVALALRDGDRDGYDAPPPVAAGGARLELTRRHVAAAADCRYLLAIGRDGEGGVRAALTERGHRSVELRRHLDVTRGELYAVRFAGTPVLAWYGGAGWPLAVARARIRHAAYLVGLSQGALDLALRRSVERRQFGQPIGRFQAPAFRLAALATRVEAARWLVRAAAWEADGLAGAVDPGTAAAGIRLSAAQALGMAADVAGAVVLAAVQAHGAYGITEASDVQLYYRRAQVDRVWMGSPEELRRGAYAQLLATARHPTGH
jgi:alkylation response protein AidB-like acyl-CoA dehydrogenase